VIGDVRDRSALEPRSRTALCASCIAGVVDAAYVWIIVAQGGPIGIGRVSFVAFAIAASAATAGIGATRPEAAARLPFLGAATGGLLALGYLGLFSIGLPLLVAGTLCGGAWIGTSRAAGPGHRRERWMAGALVIAVPCVLMAGIALT
jgi:hypothetical protein